MIQLLTGNTQMNEKSNNNKNTAKIAYFYNLNKNIQYVLKK